MCIYIHTYSQNILGYILYIVCYQTLIILSLLIYANILGIIDIHHLYKY